MDNMQRARELAAANDVIGPRPDDVPSLYWLDLRDRIAVALDAAERRGREDERLAVADEVVKAWEVLPGGTYRASTVEVWLVGHMAPLINKLRDEITAIRARGQS